MTISVTLQDYLVRNAVRYDVLTHPHSASSAQTARFAHVPAHCLAKSVVLKDQDGRYVMAVLPSTHHVELDNLRRDLDRRWQLAKESELAPLFGDCELGALPALGEAYGLPVILEPDLANAQDVYFEGGDHEALIHIAGEEFRRVMASAERLRFGALN